MDVGVHGRDLSFLLLRSYQIMSFCVTMLRQEVCVILNEGKWKGESKQYFAMLQIDIMLRRSCMYVDRVRYSDSVSTHFRSFTLLLVLHL